MLKQTTARLITLAARKTITQTLQLYNNVVQQSSRTWIPGDLSTCTKLVHARKRQCARHCMRYKFPNTDREIRLLYKILSSRLLKIC